MRTLVFRVEATVTDDGEAVPELKPWLRSAAQGPSLTLTAATLTVDDGSGPVETDLLADLDGSGDG